MSGVAVIVAKLLAHAPLTAIVNASRIRAGAMPVGTTVPAISVTTVVDDPRVLLNGRNAMNTEVVRVTVLVGDEPRGSGYPSLQSIMPLVLAACPHTRATVAGVKCDSIVALTQGPDLPSDQPAQLSRSRDFSVRWAP